MDFALTSEQEMVVDTVRDFVERELYQRHIIGRDLLRPLGA